MRMSHNRIDRLKSAVQTSRPGVCPERALVWTEYFRKRKNRKKPVSIQMAEALRDVILRKTVRIYPDELIVGNFSSKRVGGAIYPELHGVVVMQDLFTFSKRKINPLEISSREIWQLIRIIPFWLFRFLGLRAYKSKTETLRFLVDQLNSRYYFINESGGIAHLAPDYEKLIRLGADGIIALLNELLETDPPGSEQLYFHESAWGTYLLKRR